MTTKYTNKMANTKKARSYTTVANNPAPAEPAEPALHTSKALLDDAFINIPTIHEALQKIPTEERPAFVAGLLVAAGAAIGNSMCSRYMNYENAIGSMFCVVVGQPNTGKHKYAGIFAKPLIQKLDEAFEADKKRYVQWKEEQAAKRATGQDDAEGSEDGEDGNEPKKPNRGYTQGSTSESALQQAADGDGNLLYLSPEVANFLSMNSYGGEKSNFRGAICALLSEGEHTRDTKTGGLMAIKRAALAFFLGAQPDFTKQLVGPHDMGFGPRVFWFDATDAKVPKAPTQAQAQAMAGMAPVRNWEGIINKLWQHRERTEAKETHIVDLNYSAPEVFEAYAREYDARVVGAQDEGGDVAQFWGKIAVFTPRLAALHEVLMWAANGRHDNHDNNHPPKGVSLASVRFAWRMAAYFAGTFEKFVSNPLDPTVSMSKKQKALWDELPDSDTEFTKEQFHEFAIKVGVAINTAEKYRSKWRDAGIFAKHSYRKLI